MGWTKAPMPEGDTPLTFLRREYTQTYKPAQQTGFAILSDQITPAAYFAIIERTSAHDGTTQRFCIVCIYQATAAGIVFKEIDERHGPRHPAPPAFIAKLDELVPEPPNDWAYQWRDRSRLQVQPAHATQSGTTP